MAEGFPEPADVPVRKTMDPDLNVQAFQLPADVNRIKHPFRMVISGKT
jgi:hypothetical protein